MNDIRKYINAAEALFENAKPHMYAIKIAGRKIGTLWEENGEWHSEHNETGMSWAIDNKQDAIDRVVDHHREVKRSKAKTPAYIEQTLDLSPKKVTEKEDWNYDSSADEGMVAKCPNCGSTDIGTQLHPTISPSTTQLVCNDCGYEEDIPSVPAKKEPKFPAGSTMYSKAHLMKDL